MRYVETKQGTVPVKFREFDSIQEFYDWITTQPLNKHFSWKGLASTEPSKGWSKNWYGTKTYEEAIQKLKHGDDEIAKKLTNKINIKQGSMNMTVQKPSYGMAGYQASVPRYLQGIPDSMITKKAVVQKQKVVTITKNIGYLGHISAEDIINESVKAIEIIRKIEAQGTRCNLYISSIAEAGSGKDHIGVGFRCKVKSAGERLNLSKLSFVMGNPSMLRRFSFRYREVAPETTSDFTSGYGCSMQNGSIFATKKGEYFIPSMLDEYTTEKILKEMGIN